MGGITVTTKNIDKLIASLRNTIKVTNTYAQSHFIVPRCKKVLSKRYNKKGRPKKSDYDFIEIDWKDLKEKIKTK